MVSGFLGVVSSLKIYSLRLIPFAALREIINNQLRSQLNFVF